MKNKFLKCFMTCVVCLVSILQPSQLSINADDNAQEGIRKGKITIVFPEDSSETELAQFTPLTQGKIEKYTGDPEQLSETLNFSNFTRDGKKVTGNIDPGQYKVKLFDALKSSPFRIKNVNHVNKAISTTNHDYNSEAEIESDYGTPQSFEATERTNMIIRLDRKAALSEDQLQDQKINRLEFVLTNNYQKGSDTPISYVELGENLSKIQVELIYREVFESHMMEGYRNERVVARTQAQLVDGVPMIVFDDLISLIPNLHTSAWTDLTVRVDMSQFGENSKIKYNQIPIGLTVSRAGEKLDGRISRQDSREITEDLPYVMRQDNPEKNQQGAGAHQLFLNFEQELPEKEKVNKLNFDLSEFTAAEQTALLQNFKMTNRAQNYPVNLSKKIVFEGINTYKRKLDVIEDIMAKIRKIDKLSDGIVLPMLEPGEYSLWVDEVKIFESVTSKPFQIYFVVPGSEQSTSIDLNLRLNKKFRKKTIPFSTIVDELGAEHDAASLHYENVYPIDDVEFGLYQGETEILGKFVKSRTGLEIDQLPDGAYTLKQKDSNRAKILWNGKVDHAVNLNVVNSEVNIDESALENFGSFALRLWSIAGSISEEHPSKGYRSLQDEVNIGLFRNSVLLKSTKEIGDKPNSNENQGEINRLTESLNPYMNYSIKVLDLETSLYKENEDFIFKDKEDYNFDWVLNEPQCAAHIFQSAEWMLCATVGAVWGSNIGRYDNAFLKRIADRFELDVEGIDPSDVANPLNTQFELYKNDQIFVAPFKFENGKLKFERLPIGVYQLRTKNDNNYELETAKTIEVDAKGEATSDSLTPIRMKKKVVSVAETKQSIKIKFNFNNFTEGEKQSLVEFLKSKAPEVISIAKNHVGNSGALEGVIDSRLTYKLLVQIANMDPQQTEVIIEDVEPGNYSLLTQEIQFSDMLSTEPAKVLFIISDTGEVPQNITVGLEFNKKTTKIVIPFNTIVDEKGIEHAANNLKYGDTFPIKDINFSLYQGESEVSGKVTQTKDGLTIENLEDGDYVLKQKNAETAKILWNGKTDHSLPIRVQDGNMTVDANLFEASMNFALRTWSFNGYIRENLAGSVRNLNEEVSLGILENGNLIRNTKDIPVSGNYFDIGVLSNNLNPYHDYTVVVTQAEQSLYKIADSFKYKNVTSFNFDWLMNILQEGEISQIDLTKKDIVANFGPFLWGSTINYLDADFEFLQRIADRFEVNVEGINPADISNPMDTKFELFKDDQVFGSPLKYEDGKIKFERLPIGIYSLRVSSQSSYELVTPKTIEVDSNGRATTDSLTSVRMKKKNVEEVENQGPITHSVNFKLIFPEFTDVEKQAVIQKFREASTLEEFPLTLEKKLADSNGVESPRSQPEISLKLLNHFQNMGEADDFVINGISPGQYRIRSSEIRLSNSKKVKLENSYFTIAEGLTTSNEVFVELIFDKLIEKGRIFFTNIQDELGVLHNAQTLNYKGVYPIDDVEIGLYQGETEIVGKITKNRTGIEIDSLPDGAYILKQKNTELAKILWNGELDYALNFNVVDSEIKIDATHLRPAGGFKLRTWGMTGAVLDNLQNRSLHREVILGLFKNAVLQKTTEGLDLNDSDKRLSLQAIASLLNPYEDYSIGVTNPETSLYKVNENFKYKDTPAFNFTWLVAHRSTDCAVNIAVKTPICEFNPNTWGTVTSDTTNAFLKRVADRFEIDLTGVDQADLLSPVNTLFEIRKDNLEYQTPMKFENGKLKFERLPVGVYTLNTISSGKYVLSESKTIEIQANGWASDASRTPVKLIKKSVIAEEEEARRREQVERERLERERQEQVERERLERERQEQIERERLERERQEQIERERLERERQEQIERERIERERQEQIERERLERERQEQIERERIERERQEEIERERLERERQEQIERDRLERERQEQIERDRLDQERQEQIERERLERERQEQIERDRRERERQAVEGKSADQTETDGGDEPVVDSGNALVQVVESTDRNDKKIDDGADVLDVNSVDTHEDSIEDEANVLPQTGYAARTGVIGSLLMGIGFCLLFIKKLLKMKR